jgi:D-tyrosyl-tRNA(Tyr) deacylase
MKAVIQLVKRASVSVDSEIISEIKKGYCILVGIFENDTEDDILKIAQKIETIRICPDESLKLNKSIKDYQGEILLVSQFTLCANLNYGRRPSFIEAMKGDKALEFFKNLKDLLVIKGFSVKTGQFGTYMNVEIVNDGPVTIVLDSKNL